MATDRLQIRLDAVDNTRRAFSSIKGSVFNLRNALAGLGVGLVVKQFTDTGRAVENLSTRFKFLFGSAEEGSKAFNNLVRFAAKVPFSLEEISAASGNLAVVSKDANELSKILEITGNVAAVTGLDFQTTASQIQRSFAGGIASADVFREKGVRALLGFEAGATISAEATAKRFEEVFGKDGKFGKATIELSRTFDGTLSMLGDKLFKFKKDVADAEFFDAFKTELGALDLFLQENEKMFKDFAKSIGRTLATAVNAIGDGIRFVKQNIVIFTEAVRVLVGLGLAALTVSAANAFIALAGTIKSATLAMLAFNSATKKNLLFVAGGLVLSQIDKIYKGIKNLLGVMDQLPLFDPDEMEGAAVNVEKILKPIKDRESMSFLERFNAAFKELFNTFSAGSIINETVKLMKKNFDSINETIAKGIAKGVQSISKGIAESIVLGKKLGDVFRNIAQQVLVNIIAKTIEFIALQVIQIAYEKIREQIAKRQKNEIEKQNAALKRQIALQLILNALGGGGGGGGFFGFAEGGQVKARADGGGVGRGSAYMVGERGRELFIPNTDGEIVSNERLQQLGTNVNFTINATDVKGVKELLIDNRAVIVNIINSALNQKGKAALV